MVTWARVRLAAFLLLLLLALVPWTAQAGTADDPEITDDADDHILLVVPIGETGQFASADLLAVWLSQSGSDLLVSIQVSGTGNSGTLGTYTWTFVASADGTEVQASATSTADQPAPGGVATAASLADSVVTLTIPASAFGGATELTGIYVTSQGGTPGQVQGQVAIADTAPDDGADAGISYQLAASAGVAGDADGDGLNDTWETKHFGNVTKENGTGDPDGDQLNNTREQALGTDPTKADTDGDFLADGNDTAPLDPNKPVDADNDGLNDSWERQHFTATNAQNGTGDPDHDDLTNAQEQALGTDPNKADTDGDGVTDDADADPLDPSSGTAEEADGRDVKPELYGGAALFALAATFILLGLAKGI